VRSSSPRLLWLCSLVFVLSCKPKLEDVDLLVALRTDYVAGSEFTQIEVRVHGSDKRVVTEACANGDCASFALPRLVGSFDDLPQKDGRRVDVTLLDAKGQPVASDSGVIDHNQRMALVLWVTRSCAEVSCGDGERCLGESCVDAHCTDGTQRECGDLAQACERDEDCAAAACGSAVCTQGVCETQFGDDSCPDGSACVPSVGCMSGEPVQSEDDGGLPNEQDPDASTPDTENLFPDLEPAPISYVDTDGLSYNMFAWLGTEVAILTTIAELNPEVLGRILTVYDDIYRHYERVNGRSPGGSQKVAGRAVIAFLPAISASCTISGCLVPGQTGVELLEQDFVRLYTGARDEDRFDVAPLELLALSFWFYEPQLGFPNSDVIAFGFAICSALDALLSVEPGVMERSGQDLLQYRGSLERFVDTYVALGSPWTTTLQNGTAPTNNNNLGGGALVCSMMRRLEARHGGSFERAFLQAAAALPPSAGTAGTLQSASDGFLLAASRAAKADLSTVIGDRWGFPVSAAARAAAGAAGPAVDASDY
jgi:hypothetical protein